MRLLFLLFAVSLILGWYAFAIRPYKQQLSNTLFGVSGALLALLLAAFLRFI